MAGQVISSNLAGEFDKVAHYQHIYLSSQQKYWLTLCQNKEICGINVNGKEIKLSQYADDTTLILDGSEKSFLEALRMIDLFGNVSGLKLNYSKTEALWTDSNSDSDFKLCPEKNFKWPHKKVKALGVWLSKDPDLTVSLN